MQDSGILLGTFEPLTLSHMRDILYVSGQVNTLHIIITQHPNPNPAFSITLQDKARWLQMACRYLPFIKIHTFDSALLPAYDLANSTNESSTDTGKSQKNTAQYFDKRSTQALINQAITKLDIDANSTVFVTQNSVMAMQNTSTETNLDITILPELSCNSSSKTQRLQDVDNDSIHKNPLTHWQAIHPEARGDYTRTVAIVGGESSGKTTLVHKLSNYYGASLALEMGRLYVGTDLGGSEVGLQYSDYAPIVLDHAEAVRKAQYQAPAPITIIDTDFVTTQAFCEVYEGQTHPVVAACIDEFRFDHTLFLANNTPWVDDGMRSLGSKSARERFENKLTEIFARHDINPHRIVSPDYFERYKQALHYIENTILTDNKY